MKLLPVAILAGGLATRLYPVTQTIPKSLLMIEGEPFIAHQLRLLAKAGITRVVLCVGYLGEEIITYVSKNNSFGLEIHFVQEKDILLGTGGALKNALPLLGEQFFVLYGDSYLNCAYVDIQAAFLRSGKQALMTVLRNDNQWDTSNIIFEQGRIICYDKHKQDLAMRYIDYGLGLFQASAFDWVAPHTVVDLASIYQQCLRDQQLAAYEVTQRFYEIGSKHGIQAFSEYVQTTLHARSIA